MTPKEKAKELVQKYIFIDVSIEIDNLDFFFFETEIGYDPRKCALIAVDEIINELVKLSNGEFTFIHRVEYWQEVKQEIESYEN